MDTTVVFIRSRPFLGSQIVVYPLLCQLRRAQPKSRILVVAQDSLRHYYHHLPWVDQFIQTNGPREMYRCMPIGTRLAVGLHRGSEWPGLLTAIRRIPTRLGFQNHRVSDILWTHKTRHNPGEYIGLANLKLLRTWCDFDVGGAARHSMVELATQRSGRVACTNVVFMVGGGAGTFKRWGIHNYVSLSRWLDTVMGGDITFTFILGPDERKEAAMLSQGSHPRFQLMVSHSLADIAYVTLNASLVIANDCGPSHIAQNACIPYVGLFHQANPQWFWKRHGAISVTPHEPSNIQSITVEQVFAACLRVLKEAESTCP